MNRTGMSRPSPTANCCGLKQKHWVLWKYLAATRRRDARHGLRHRRPLSQILRIKLGVVELPRMHAHARRPSGGIRSCPPMRGRRRTRRSPRGSDRWLRGLGRLPDFASALPIPATLQNTSYKGTNAQPNAKLPAVMISKPRDQACDWRAFARLHRARPDSDQLMPSVLKPSVMTAIDEQVR